MGEDKKNKLVPRYVRKNYEATHGVPYPEHRHSGRTTGCALLAIGQAMTHPGDKIQLIDHNSTKFDDTLHLAYTIQNIIGNLRLKCFNIEKDIMNYKMYLIYNPFE